jgi:hypothetical protein
MAHKIPGFRNVSAKEVRELSKLPWVRDEAFSDRTFEARVLPDGRVLLYLGEGERAALYPSREALAEVLREGQEEAARGPVDYTRTLLPPIEDFLRDVDAHARGLGKAIGVPDAVLDRGIDSLDVAYRAVLRLRRAKRMTPEVFTPLVAYVGEVMRAASGGEWTRSVVRRHENEPMLKAHDGRLLQPFAIVLVEVMEHGARGSLMGAVAGTLAPYTKKTTGS